MDMTSFHTVGQKATYTIYTLSRSKIHRRKYVPNEEIYSSNVHNITNIKGATISPKIITGKGGVKIILAYGRPILLELQSTTPLSFLRKQ